MAGEPVIEIVSLGRPLTTNALLSGRSHVWRYRRRKLWRTAAHDAAIARGPVDLPSTPCAVEVTVLWAGGSKQDVGSCAPAAKAAIDGLIDAGWLDDDDPEHVARIIYTQHQRHAAHGLRLTLRDHVDVPVSERYCALAAQRLASVTEPML